MLTRIKIRNFKCFDEVDFELGATVIFIGPNNSGKTTALQALTLWYVGLRQWYEKRGGRTTAKQRPGVTINRRDLVAVPIPQANLLWNNLRTREVQHGEKGQETTNIRIEIIVTGETKGKSWECGLEFDYANEESIYCRPLRIGENQRMDVPIEALQMDVALLPPMSGLATNELRLDTGAINVRIGEGRTAEVLRNLCYKIVAPNGSNQNGQGEAAWERLCKQIRDLFGVELERPIYLAERGEITMSYHNLRRSSESRKVSLDISTSGRGLQQTLLLLAYLEANPKSVLLLDEPDAHLEILRQRQIYDVLTQTARDRDSQIIAASHSEVILNEAANRDMVVAFVGKPHRIDTRSGSQVLKALSDIGYEAYYQAEQKGWVLYLEGSTDLAILRSFASILDHSVQKELERPFVHYVADKPKQARHHFYGLREAKSDLVGFALFDRLDQKLEDGYLQEYMWRRREIENYFCTREVLNAWAKDRAYRDSGPLFEVEYLRIMDEIIEEISQARRTLNQTDPWDPQTKVSDEFLPILFAKFFKHFQLSNSMNKTNYHLLVSYMEKSAIEQEVIDVLDKIQLIASKANPR